MKKFLFGILLIGVIAGVIYLCSDGDDNHYDYEEVKRPTCLEDVITWNKLDTVVIGDGLLKLEYPDCFELGDSICGDSDVTVSYKDKEDLFLTASVTANEMHLNTDELADYVVNMINEEGNDTVTMQDMHDGYFYLTCEPKRTRFRSYEQYVVEHDFIYRLCLMFPSHLENKLRKLKEYVHGWNPKTKKAIWSGPWEEPRERMSVLKKKVGEHNYREFCIEQGDNGYHFMVYDSCHHNCQEVVFDADDYMNEGVPGMYAFVSPDKKYVYVVGDILANSTGWIATFIIYQVNTETLKAKLVNAVAGIRLEEKGFTVASMTRCVTPDAQCSAGMDFAFEDITYGFNGKIKRRSKEYASKEIKKRYGESLNNLRGLGIIRGQYD
jgi:hypothetical protein